MTASFDNKQLYELCRFEHQNTVLGVPCLTLRNSTERPETVTIGTNELIGTDPSNLVLFLQKLQSGAWKPSGIPELWDGKTSERIVEKLLHLYGKRKQNTTDPVLVA